MEKIVLCVPNISEGRDEAKVAAVVGEVKRFDAVKLLDVDPDKEHNRTVITFAGGPQDVYRAAYWLIHKAVDLIDMEHHRGEHPRLGAVDVCPFVPFRGVEMAECVGLARRLARLVALDLKLPVYLYGEAATRPERKKLSDIRKGEYEGLAAKLQDPNWYPDFGWAKFNPKSGAIVVGARDMMVAFNVNLKTDNLDLARTIAKLIRGSSNGIFPSVQAVGIDTRSKGYVQVSMNLHNYKVDSLGAVFQAIKFLAKAEGVKIHSSEIIGVVPRDALAGVWLEGLKLKNFNPKEKIIEEALGL